jgi:hypothetical protein
MSVLFRPYTHPLKSLSYFAPHFIHKTHRRSKMAKKFVDVPIPKKIDNQRVTRGLVDQPPKPRDVGSGRVRHDVAEARSKPRGTGTRSPL